MIEKHAAHVQQLVKGQLPAIKWPKNTSDWTWHGNPRLNSFLGLQWYCYWKRTTWPKLIYSVLSITTLNNPAIYLRISTVLSLQHFWRWQWSDTPIWPAPLWRTSQPQECATQLRWRSHMRSPFSEGFQVTVRHSVESPTIAALVSTPPLKLLPKLLLSRLENRPSTRKLYWYFQSSAIRHTRRHFPFFLCICLTSVLSPLGQTLLIVHRKLPRISPITPEWT